MLIERGIELVEKVVRHNRMLFSEDVYVHV